jgi:hypothetical protein
MNVLVYGYVLPEQVGLRSVRLTALDEVIALGGFLRMLL